MWSKTFNANSQILKTCKQIRNMTYNPNYSFESTGNDLSLKTQIMQVNIRCGTGLKDLLFFTIYSLVYMDKGVCGEGWGGRSADFECFTLGLSFTVALGCNEIFPFHYILNYIWVLNKYIYIYNLRTLM